MDHRLRKMIALFNGRSFFEFHQTAEELYLERPEQDKPFFEAMAQLGIACRFFCDFEEVQGPVRLIRQALIRLEAYGPDYLGIRVNDLSRDMDAWVSQAEQVRAERANLQQKIPKIRTRWFS